MRMERVSIIITDNMTSISEDCGWPLLPRSRNMESSHENYFKQKKSIHKECLNIILKDSIECFPVWLICGVFVMERNKTRNILRQILHFTLFYLVQITIYENQKQHKITFCLPFFKDMWWLTTCYWFCIHNCENKQHGLQTSSSASHRMRKLST